MNAQLLPNELWMCIIGECAARTRMRLEQTCTRMHALVRDYEWRVPAMDVQREFDFGDFVAFSQVLDYLRHRCARLCSRWLVCRYGKLSHLSLRALPTSLNARALRELFAAHPHIRSLNLAHRYTLPRMHPQTLTALEFGRHRMGSVYTVDEQQHV